MCAQKVLKIFARARYALRTLAEVAPVEILACGPGAARALGRCI